MIITLEKGFHALSLGIMFLLMMSLLEAQIPSEPSDLASEMDFFATILRGTGLVYIAVATTTFLMAPFSLWRRAAPFSSWLQNNAIKVSFTFNLASVAIVAYFIVWFWAIPC